MPEPVACLNSVASATRYSPLPDGLPDCTLHDTDRLDQLAAWVECDAVRAVLFTVPPGQPDMSAISEFAARYPRVPIVALVEAAQLELASVRDFIIDCCHDYHTLPADPARLRTTVGHAVGLRALWSGRNGRGRAVPSPFYGMVGQSPAMQALFHDLRKVAAVQAAVLIGGESGTGKELAAQAIHRLSSVRDGPFVVVNCGALPASLIGAELFGHERGAFTGAVAQRAGRLEQAHGGTVLLDEIGDLPLDLQSHLLRFLQEGTIDRIGGRQPVHVRARVLSASHVDLAEAIRAGRFREDLYYRLNVLRIHMPCLRERLEDLPPLAHYFLEQFRREHGGRCRGFTPHALQRMQHYDWPGNVRELVNCIRRAAVMADGALIGADNLGLERRHHLRTDRFKTLDEVRRESERAALRAALKQAGDNVSAAARQLDVSRVTLYRLLQRHGIRLDRYGVTDNGAGDDGHYSGPDADAIAH